VRGRVVQYFRRRFFCDRPTRLPRAGTAVESVTARGVAALADTRAHLCSASRATAAAMHWRSDRDPLSFGACFSQMVWANLASPRGDATAGGGSALAASTNAQNLIGTITTDHQIQRSRINLPRRLLRSKLGPAHGWVGMEIWLEEYGGVRRIITKPVLPGLHRSAWACFSQRACHRVSPAAA